MVRKEASLDYVLLRDVPQQLSACLSVHPATVYRWASSGIAGVRLRCASLGGRRATTREWLQEFFDAVEIARDRAQRRAPASANTAEEELEPKATTETLRRFGID